MRQQYSTRSPWEPRVGYSRAVRVGQHVYIAGTTALDDDGKLVGAGSAYLQAVRILRNIETALNAVGADISSVVRTRMYVIDIAAHADEVGRAHGEMFRNIRPVSTMVEVARLIDPRMLVEMEAEAVL